ncbi:hypothetical protein BP6252_14045 [Coleophoma cylindrospora]|uniref:Rhodopsin domain-containing protein n=1 Tax=Coleophoma cylindrospora TaxID=1849047 RepID=A0A3D8Q4D7_9HELO|nr:hypothetical protein BP6252_14045 [Coleophoma cylindrospora]
MAVKLYELTAIPIVRTEFVVNTILIILATIAVVLRLLARRARRIALWWDDYTILIALFLTYFLYAVQIADAKLGMRIHITEVPAKNLALILKMLVAYQLIYGTVQALAKVSYLFFYLRIFVNKGFIKAVKIVAAIVVAWWTANVLQVFLICTPFKLNYDVTVTGTCGNRPAAYTAIGAINLITDVAILLLPIPTVWKLQMPVSSKIGICGIFTIGLRCLIPRTTRSHPLTVSSICIISIIRMQSMATLNFNDITYDMINPVFWTVTEPSLAIINACLPVMRHLMKIVFGKQAWFRSKSDTSRQYSTTFERMQDGEYPLNNLHDRERGLTSSSVAAKKAYSVGENESENSYDETKHEPRSNIHVTTAWVVSD